MPYKDATAFAASLAATLMVSIVVFQPGDGTHGAMPADEFDDDERMVKLEIDPFQLGEVASRHRPGAHPGLFGLAASCLVRKRRRYQGRVDRSLPGEHFQ